MNNHLRKEKSNLDFRMMALFFKIRDFFKDPMKKIEKINLKEGDYILEYGCGSGSFTMPIAKNVGSSGKVFAADIHPLASEKVRKRTEKSEINNIETIVTDCNIDLEDQSIDKVVLIDVLHNLSNYEANIKEFHRLLKDDGKLWVDDHHYDEEEIRVKITKNNLFKYESKVDSLFEFEKNSKV